jgi:hypothetical protein
VKGLRRYWGWALLIIVLAATIYGSVGPPVLLAASGVILFYFLFNVPDWCCAINRNGTLCRNNSHGILLGCSKVRQHKWQKIKLTFVGYYWRKVGAEIKAQPIEGLKTVTALLGLLGGIITLTVATTKIITG